MDDLIEKGSPTPMMNNGAPTACPTNIGTGMRARLCLIALYGFSRSNQLPIQAITKAGLTMRGFMGRTNFSDLFQISNQIPGLVGGRDHCQIAFSGEGELKGKIDS